MDKKLLVTSVLTLVARTHRHTKILLESYCPEINDSKLTALVSDVVSASEKVITYIGGRTGG